MSHVKAGGTAKNIHNNAGQRLGVKRFGGQKSSKRRSVSTPNWQHKDCWAWHLYLTQFYHSRSKRWRCPLCKDEKDPFFRKILAASARRSSLS